jgi:DNA repair protein RadC
MEYPMMVNEEALMPAEIVNKKRRQKKALKLQTLVFTRTKATGPYMRCGADFNRQYSDLAKLDREVFVAVTMDQKNRVIGSYIVSMGTLTASLVHPRECFKAAIYDCAASIAFVHNHPSGSPSPSRQDRELNERITEAAKLLGIRYLDHVIIGADGYFSFMENGWM